MEIAGIMGEGLPPPPSLGTSQFAAVFLKKVPLNSKKMMEGHHEEKNVENHWLREIRGKQTTLEQRKKINLVVWVTSGPV